MPSNQQHLDKDEKKQKVIAAANKLFLEKGYANTSMSSIAKEAGITPNTIYWYYAGKDELLAVVVDRLTDLLSAAIDSISEKTTLNEIIHWVLAHFASASSIASSLHDRSQHSNIVEQSHQRFHKIFETKFSQILISHGHSTKQAKTAIQITTFIIEGLLIHTLKEEEQNEILDSLQRNILQP